MIPLRLPDPSAPSIAEIKFWLSCYLRRQRPGSAIDADTPLAALALDSFERVELAMTLEARYGLPDDGSVHYDADTVGALSHLVREMLAARAAANRSDA
jgi:acyl carrier protein